MKSSISITRAEFIRLKFYIFLRNQCHDYKILIQFQIQN